MHQIHVLFNIIICTASLTLVLISLFLTLTDYYLRRWSQRFFVALFVFLAAYISCILAYMLVIERAGAIYLFLSRMANFLQSLFSSLMMPLLTLYILHSCGESLKKNVLFRIAMALWLVYFGLLLTTLFTGWIFYIDNSNVYHRGPWYPLLLSPPALLVALNLFVLCRRRKQFSSREQKAIFSFLLLPELGILLQMRFYGLPLIAFGASLGAVVMFLYIRAEQTDSYVRQQEENARQKASILALQMRPHFIYNTLMSIYYLCRQDAEKAQQVILDFSSYLRKNFTAIGKEDTIPFAEELEHTRAYLAVEQVRFEGLLFVEFDTPHTAFRIPPLTLQPIVENAVKHGIDPDLDPLHILVYTRETASGSLVVVEDTGSGFVSADDGEPHIALANIRSRLEMMCRGTLTITPREGGGTIVTVTVPEKP
ncbi:MAG: histidine kinase [Oscillospiraceae bacterium]|nr:histidine kinase [Oscillospiraceae bacterium]